MINKRVFNLARVLHIARLHDCYGHGEQFERALAKQPWPISRKNAVRLYQNGQSWMEIAVAQAEAALEFLEGHS